VSVDNVKDESTAQAEIQDWMDPAGCSITGNCNFTTAAASSSSSGRTSRDGTIATHGQSRSSIKSSTGFSDSAVSVSSSSSDAINSPNNAAAAAANSNLNPNLNQHHQNSNGSEGGSTSTFAAARNSSVASSPSFAISASPSIRSSLSPRKTFQGGIIAGGGQNAAGGNQNMNNPNFVDEERMKFLTQQLYGVCQVGPNEDHIFESALKDLDSWGGFDMLSAMTLADNHEHLVVVMFMKIVIKQDLFHSVCIEFSPLFQFRENSTRLPPSRRSLPQLPASRRYVAVL